MTTSKQSDNLSGLWTGVYDYPDGYAEPVPFNAIVTDEGGALGGDITEPNTFSDAKDRELYAVISGTRRGDEVHFVKSYEGRPQADHSIAYRGTLDPARTRIDGTWHVMEPGSAWGGPFVMNRASGKKEEISAQEKAGRETEIVK